MTQNDISNSQNQEQNCQDDTNANYLNPTTKIWFYIPFDRWFLTKDEKNPLQGIESWFDSPTKINQTVNKPKKRKRIDLSLVDVKISKDPELLKQYYDLREEAYRNDSGFSNYSGDENEFDREGVIFLGIFEDKVVAGARLVSSSNIAYLPHENPEKKFTYLDLCKTVDIDLSGTIYSEISALTIKRELRSNFLDNLFGCIVDYCRSENIKYVFGVADLVCSRDYRMAIEKVGIKSIFINKVIAPRKPEFNNIDSYITVGVI